MRASTAYAPWIAHQGFDDIADLFKAMHNVGEGALRTALNRGLMTFTEISLAPALKPVKGPKIDIELKINFENMDAAARNNSTQRLRTYLNASADASALARWE